eukprot:CAMPEP_0177677656 /NCGR_PEP_ID=MMETSP0447-20121125/28536_1 /TAXON_ID=0 /ORGANISM="Stygamoeba regulata, Strain BSH-02190019" /LENGTH=69 /DNA_ID=CAMNT_0019186495 /DNA_START=9 /DNA_END=215 /DNA_ORIENTATION=+
MAAIKKFGTAGRSVGKKIGSGMKRASIMPNSSGSSAPDSDDEGDGGHEFGQQTDFDDDVLFGANPVRAL